MQLEEAVLEAIKQKLVDTFKKVQVSSAIEGREIVIRISIPEDIMNTPNITIEGHTYSAVRVPSNLDDEAQRAARELLP